MKTHLENSKKFEIGKFLIKKIYNIKEKKKPGYKVIKKNVVYQKLITRQYFKYSNINLDNYYSNYQSFREYLSSGYDHEFLSNEIKNIRSIIDYSRSIREIISRKLNPAIPLKESIHQNPAIIEGPSGNNVNNQNNIFQKNGLNRRKSTVFEIDKDNPNMKRIADMAHGNANLGGNNQKKNNKFIEKCLLLKKKEEEMDSSENQYHFRLYSALSEEFDPLLLPVYEHFIKIKYENQKNCLVNCYNKEREFIDFAKSKKEILKAKIEESKKNRKNQLENSDSFNSGNILQQSNIKENNDINTKNKKLTEPLLKIPYINAFFFGRTEMYFRDIDNFMSMYKENTSLASKQLEKDFFENLYKILTFNNTNCKRFLHYLYSNSNFFKYIYNIFTTQKKLDGTLKNIAPSIKRHSEDGHFLNKPLKEMFLSEDKEKEEEESKNIFNQREEENEKLKDSKKDLNDFINLFLGNDFIYKINLIQDDVAELVDKKQIKKFKKLIMNNELYKNNFIITVNNQDNMLQIYNTENNQCIFSYYFDETISFYDLSKDLKNNLKIEKNQKNEKYILIYRKNDYSDINDSYIFKMSGGVYNRFCKSITLKGFKMKKTELFGSGEKEKEKENDEQNNKNNKKLDLEDLLTLQNEEEKNQSEEHGQNSEKSSAKNESNIKFDQRNNSRSISFRNNNSNNKSEKSEDEEKENFKKNNDSSMEVKEKEGEDSEEDENEDNDDNDGEEDENDNNDEEEKNINEENKKNKNEEEDENTDKDNINNNNTEEKDEDKNEDNNTNKNKNNQNENEEEINTDIIGQNIINNNPTIESEHKSSDKEE